MQPAYCAQGQQDKSNYDQDDDANMMMMMIIMTTTMMMMMITLIMITALSRLILCTWSVKFSERASS